MSTTLAPPPNPTPPELLPTPPSAEPPKPKRSRGKIAAIVVGGILLLGIGASLGSETDAPQTRANEPAAPVQESTAPEPSEVPEPTPAPEVVEPVFTVSQENAIQTANDYLDYTAFSESGLIDQLEFEGYSKADARFAVNHVSVNWNEQAARSAKDYLDYSSFSRQGLIDQLEFEGFTTQQATYGVNTTGL